MRFYFCIASLIASLLTGAAQNTAPVLAQEPRVKAETGGIVIEGNVEDSCIGNCSVSLEQFQSIMAEFKSFSEDQKLAIEQLKLNSTLNRKQLLAVLEIAESLSISDKTLSDTILGLSKDIKAVSPAISNVIVLKSTNKDKFAIEFTLSNPSNVVPAWTKSLNLSSDLELKAAGISGFIDSVTYNVQVGLDGKGAVIGVATEKPDAEFGYPVSGSFDYGIDTRERGAKYWNVKLGIPLQIKIEPGEKLRLTLVFSKPSGTFLKAEKDGEAIAMSIMGLLKSTNNLSIISDNLKSSEVTFDGTEFLEWFTENVKL